jgi:hypothetical protein
VHRATCTARAYRVERRAQSKREEGRCARDLDPEGDRTRGTGACTGRGNSRRVTALRRLGSRACRVRFARSWRAGGNSPEPRGVSGAHRPRRTAQDARLGGCKSSLCRSGAPRDTPLRSAPHEPSHEPRRGSVRAFAIAHGRSETTSHTSPGGETR